MPMMAFIGVRISWLMVARNVLLARVACSAASLATRTSASAARARALSRAWAHSARRRVAMLLKEVATWPSSSLVSRVTTWSTEPPSMRSEASLSRLTVVMTPR